MDRLVRAMWNIRFRGKARLLSPLVPREGVRKARVFNTEIELDLSDWVQRMMYLGCFESPETKLLLNYLQPGMTFVDVGANCGYFSYLAFSRLGHSGKVLAIEPDPVLFGELSATIRENHHSEITALNIGLGSQPGDLYLYIPPASFANRTPTMTHVDGWEKTLVPIRTLDDVLDKAQIQQVDVLKLDVEGFENEVLTGGMGALKAGRIRSILCEFNSYWLSRNGTSSDQLWQTLLELGFRPEAPKPEFTPSTLVTEFFIHR